MKIILTLLPILVLAFCSCKNDNDIASPGEQTKTSIIEVLDNRLKDYIKTTASLDTLGEGYNWAEGPLWLPSISTLIFSDVPENKIYQWKEGQQVSLYLEPSGYTGEVPRGGEPGSNGLALDSDGHLILAQHGDRRIARMNTSIDAPSPDFHTISGEFQGKKFNSPNDLCVANDGKIFFTDPPYGLVNEEARETNFQGVYLIDTDGNVKLLIDSISRPNGIALSNNEDKLYIACSDPEKAVWYEYTLSQDKANITAGKILYDVTDMVGKKPGLPDGLRVHSSGLLFCTGPGGVHILDPSGQPLGLIKTNKGTANCTFDDREEYLYMTADDQLLRIKL